MSISNKQQSVQSSLNLAVPGWFLLIAGIWELLFNRLASALGLYTGIGAIGFLSRLADSGRLAMNACGIMALVLICSSLPRLASNPRFAPLPARVALMLASPFYLPIICVTILRAVSAEFILVGYLVTVGSAVFISVLIALKGIDASRRRVIIALGLVQIFCAFELLQVFKLSHWR